MHAQTLEAGKLTEQLHVRIFGVLQELFGRAEQLQEA